MSGKRHRNKLTTADDTRASPSPTFVRDNCCISSFTTFSRPPPPDNRPRISEAAAMNGRLFGEENPYNEEWNRDKNKQQKVNELQEIKIKRGERENVKIERPAAKTTPTASAHTKNGSRDISATDVVVPPTACVCVCCTLCVWALKPQRQSLLYAQWRDCEIETVYKKGTRGESERVKKKVEKKTPTIDTIIKTHTHTIYIHLAFESRCGGAWWLFWRDKNNVIVDDGDDDKTIECEMCWWERQNKNTNSNS